MVNLDGRSEGSLWATTSSAAGAMFGAAVSPSDQKDTLEPAVAMTPDGRMLALWTRSDDNVARPQLSLAGAAAASGSFGALALDEVGADCTRHRCLHGGAASAAPTPDGRCAVAWVEKANPTLSSGGIVVAATFTPAELARADDHRPR
jgi:hypothetical protein